MDLMDDYGSMQERVTQMENDMFNMRQTGGPQARSSSLFDSVMITINDSEKQKYEETIKQLEQQLIKVQDGKLTNTESLLEFTNQNKKLQEENAKLIKNNKDLQERLQEVEDSLSNKCQEISELEDKVESLQLELEAREKLLEDITEKNKELAKDQQMLTNRFLEEKAKWVEVMNEANSVYEGARLSQLGSNSFNNKDLS